MVKCPLIKYFAWNFFVATSSKNIIATLRIVTIEKSELRFLLILYFHGIEIIQNLTPPLSLVCKCRHLSTLIILCVRINCRHPRVFLIALRGAGEWEILLGRIFLTKVVGTWGGVFLAIWTFSKLQTTFCKYWTFIKIYIILTSV